MAWYYDRHNISMQEGSFSAQVKRSMTAGRFRAFAFLKIPTLFSHICQTFRDAVFQEIKHLHFGTRPAITQARGNERRKQK
jgi:hypothetical protein